MQKNKRNQVPMILFVLLLFAVAAVTLYQPQKVKAAEKEFIVGFDAEFPPYGYLDENGEYVGFDLDLAEEVCNRNGWKLVKRPISWDSKDSELASGAISCIWNGFTMNGREDQYTWTTQMCIRDSSYSVNHASSMPS